MLELRFIYLFVNHLTLTQGAHKVFPVDSKLDMELSFKTWF